MRASDRWLCSEAPRAAKASSAIGHPCSAESAVQSETNGSRALFPASRRAATRPSMDQAPAPHAARMSMPPAIARSFWKWSSSFRTPNFVWNRTAVATQNTPSAAAANRAPKPIARAVPAAICKAMAARASGATTPSFAIALSAASRLPARVRPSWTKSHASNSRPSSRIGPARSATMRRKCAISRSPLQVRRVGTQGARPRLSSVPCPGVDRPLEVVALLAPGRAQPLEGGELVFGEVELVGFEEELAEVLARRLVAWLELQRLGVVGERGRVVAGLAQREPEQAVDVGVLGVLHEVAQLLFRRGVVLRLDLRADGREVDAVAGGHVVDRERPDRDKGRRGEDGRERERAEALEADHGLHCSVPSGLVGGRERIGVPVLREDPGAREREMRAADRHLVGDDAVDQLSAARNRGRPVWS